jgi:mRNA-degrading endonuclease RelE of RelBE toxin-antitoxin system
MRLKITIEQQPLEFIRRQPPANRKRLREVLRAVERGSVFPDPLEDELEGFYKVRVERYRLILQSVTKCSASFSAWNDYQRRKSLSLRPPAMLPSPHK